MRLPSSKYRGVVAQQNGKWGAQIYNNNERIWLGTFCTEVEAAKTYDLAARCLHQAHAITNFNSSTKSNSDTEAELHFMKSKTTTEILDMLRRQTYHEEFSRSWHKRQNNSGNITGSTEKEDRQLLFVKVVSPGDIGPQSRLLIPRHHAQNHFRLFGGYSSAIHRGVMINFEDARGKIWRFRYAYWSSSHNHVLNGGWAQFAREKRLRPGDVVRFWRVTNELGDKHLFIECDEKKSVTRMSPSLESSVQSDEVVRLFGVNISTRASSKQSVQFVWN